MKIKTNEEWSGDIENAISSSTSCILPILVGSGISVVSDGMCVLSCCKKLVQTGMGEAAGDTLRIPPTRAALQPGCGYFSPSPRPDHRCKWYEEGKMEGVPDPGNPQLPPSLPGGTRGQRRLTQPTAGTGLRPARPRDQRTWRWLRATFRAPPPPPHPALQQPLSSLINQTHPLQLVAAQNGFFSPIYCAGCSWPGALSELIIGIQSPFLSILLGERHACVLAAFFLDELKRGLLTPNDKSWWCGAGNHHEVVTRRSSAEACNELCPVLCGVLAGQTSSRRKEAGENYMHHYFGL